MSRIEYQRYAPGDRVVYRNAPMYGDSVLLVAEESGPRASRVELVDHWRRFPKHDLIKLHPGESSDSMRVKTLRRLMDEADAAAEAVRALILEAPPAPSLFDVFLTSGGDKKIQVIKVVRDWTSMGLAEAKAFVEAPAGRAFRNLSREDADRLCVQLRAAGATAGAVEVQS